MTKCYGDSCSVDPQGSYTKTYTSGTKPPACCYTCHVNKQIVAARKQYPGFEITPDYDAHWTCYCDEGRVKPHGRSVHCRHRTKWGGIWCWVWLSRTCRGTTKWEKASVLLPVYWIGYVLVYSPLTLAGVLPGWGHWVQYILW